MTKTQAYNQLVRRLKAAMAQPRSEREPYYVAAAEAVVELRKAYPLDGRPDWNGASEDYRAVVRAAYRDAQVPSDSEDTVQAALRHHIGQAVRAAAPEADLEALGRHKTAPTKRSSRDTPTRPRKAVGSTNGSATPDTLLRALEDPVGLVRFAIRSLEAAKSLKPSGPEAETVRYMLKTLSEAVEALACVVGEHD